MNEINKIVDKMKYVRQRLYVKFMMCKVALKTSFRSSKRRIYFFCTPSHSNLGDQAQLYCWLRLMKKWYPNYDIVRVPTVSRRSNTLHKVHHILNEDDLLFIHSGYLLFDPHPELPFILDIVREFKDHRVAILPQTVNIMGGAKSTTCC